MAKALEDNVLQNYVKASTDAKQEKNPDEILQERARIYTIQSCRPLMRAASCIGRLSE